MKPIVYYASKLWLNRGVVLLLLLDASAYSWYIPHTILGHGVFVEVSDGACDFAFLHVILTFVGVLQLAVLIAFVMYQCAQLFSRVDDIATRAVQNHEADS
jgi:hypothetical protein